MNAEFIYKPISGQFSEKHFGKTTPYCLWVKFIDKKSQEWIGSFEEGCNEQARFIIILREQDKVFIVSSGQTYLININTREQINKIEIEDTRTAIVDFEKKNIYYTNGLDLRFMDIHGNEFILFDEYYLEHAKLIEIKNYCHPTKIKISQRRCISGVSSWYFVFLKKHPFFS
jgi:hypothetical protein